MRKSLILFIVLLVISGCGFTAFRYKYFLNENSNAFRFPNIDPKSQQELFLENDYILIDSIQIRIKISVSGENDGLFKSNKDFYERDNYYLFFSYENLSSTIDFDKYSYVLIENLRILNDTTKEVLFINNNNSIILTKDESFYGLNDEIFIIHEITIPNNIEYLEVSFDFSICDEFDNKKYFYPINLKLRKWQKIKYEPYFLLYV